VPNRVNYFRTLLYRRQSGLIIYIRCSSTVTTACDYLVKKIILINKNRDITFFTIESSYRIAISESLLI
jgi:hypothetical protein